MSCDFAGVSGQLQGHVKLEAISLPCAGAEFKRNSSDSTFGMVGKTTADSSLVYLTMDRRRSVSFETSRCDSHMSSLRHHLTTVGSLTRLEQLRLKCAYISSYLGPLAKGAAVFFGRDGCFDCLERPAFLTRLRFLTFGTRLPWDARAVLFLVVLLAVTSSDSTLASDPLESSLELITSAASAFCCVARRTVTILVVFVEETSATTPYDLWIHRGSSSSS